MAYVAGHLLTSEEGIIEGSVDKGNIASKATYDYPQKGMRGIVTNKAH